LYKHLTFEQRVIIEDRLNKKLSIRSIAKELGVSPSTIQREIKRHSQISPAAGNDCKYRYDCDVKGLCQKPGCNRKCKKCTNKRCKVFCKAYEKEDCFKLIASPYRLCNGCQFSICNNERRYYIADSAEKNYQVNLVSKRCGFDVTDSEMEQIDRLASPLIKNGLSPYHILQTYGEKIPVSESTLRRMIDQRELTAKNIDLRDKVKRKPRKSTRNAARNRAIALSKVGHLYSDYLFYTNKYDTFTVEMDCVEGLKSEPATLLTLTWRELSFQLAIIMEEHTTEAVVTALDKIEESLGTGLFKRVFPLILTDNGMEFNNVTAMETSKSGCQRTRIYFCEPNRSDQKGTCENHHKMIRYCIPKGTSLEPYSQADVSLMMNYINSYKRKALFGKSAFDLAKEALPEDFFTLLGLEQVAPEDIILSPKLFRA